MNEQMQKPNKPHNDASIQHLKQELLAAKRLQHQLWRELNTTHNSLSWRITHPLRVSNAFVQKIGFPVNSLRSYFSAFRRSVNILGLRKTIQKSLRFIANKRADQSSLLEDGAAAHNQEIGRFYPKEISEIASTILTPRVLIVAELSLPQCKKYRVTQKAELFSRLGVETTIVDWNDTEKARTKLQSHSLVIFYRVPGYPSVIALVSEAKRLGMPTFWEVDDLIFDIDSYLLNRNLDTLEPELKDSVLAGVPLYRKALLSCDAGIGSTRLLARAMANATGKTAYVIENALDSETIAEARRIRHSSRLAKQNSRDDKITIVYGSGSKAHDSDFMEASEAIYNVLLQRKNVMLCIIGDLNLENRFDDVAAQVLRLPFTNFEEYLATIAGADISIAPLEETAFNDAKSNIKYLEASILGIPSVCSPRDAFKEIITNGENGFLAKDKVEWHHQLLTLIDKPSVRQGMAKKAHKHVHRNYYPTTIAKKQIAPIISLLNERSKDCIRILFANVFFSPQSFGGATVVAEELSERLAENPNVEVYVFTSWPNERASDYGVVRYTAKGATVFAVKVPPIRTRYMDIDDEAIGEQFEEVLRAVKPDVVHLHSIQTLGVALASACRDQGIPYAITLHDAWWICERQFMVTGENKYCFQTRIDPAVCAKCVPDKNFNRFRTDVLRWELLEADSLIAPSEYFKQLHIQNGFPANKIFVNKNGIRLPAAGYQRSRSDRLRFGYVGGISPIKGYDLIIEAYSSLPQCAIELIIVDNTLNLGYGTVDVAAVKALNPLRVVPAYSQDTIDDFFADVDVLLFPTQWKESFGLTVREALIRDVWVIASDAGGVVEDIRDGENGYIIPISRDSTYLKEAIELCIKNSVDLKGFQNPFKAQIQTFDGQARELRDHLQVLAQKNTAQT